ncbi:tyrosine-type recombinase/integrase [Halochromatium salexigens]|nr:tyrosine-type recombinase/integrase [Halochromatium salexigens]
MMREPLIPVSEPAPIDWLPWCLSDSAETSPHPGALPPVPAGGSGWLIAPERGHLADCRTDLQAVSRWLARQKDQPLTLEAYRHELERFLLWLGLERGKALSEATGEDISLFDDLLQYPERWPQWYGERHPRSDPRWRPWTQKLSARSRHEALTTVERCYAWLIKQGYLRYNPFEAAAVRLRAPRLAAVQARYLDERLWQAVLEQVQAMPQATATQRARYERTRWVVMALYALLARASEFCHARMGDLVPLRRPSGVQWWWQVRGKHRTEADAPDEVPIPPALIEALSRYRTHLGLSPLPEPGETTPMVLSLYPKRDGWAPVNRSTLWRVVKQVFAATADTIEANDPDGAAHLRAASPHWLRHTGITHRLDEGLGLKEAQALSRHRSLKDLGTYAHADRDALYARVAGWHVPLPAADAT